MFVVLLHWLCMFLTLVIPNKLFKRDGESGRSGNVKWILKSLVLAYIYIFAYLNLESDKHQVRLRMALYYGVIFAENLLLVTLWSIETRTALHHSKSDRVRVFLSASLPFIAGKLNILISCHRSTIALQSVMRAKLSLHMSSPCHEHRGSPGGFR